MGTICSPSFKGKSDIEDGQIAPPVIFLRALIAHHRTRKMAHPTKQPTVGTRASRSHWTTTRPLENGHFVRNSGRTRSRFEITSSFFPFPPPAFACLWRHLRAALGSSSPICCLRRLSYARKLRIVGISFRSAIFAAYPASIFSVGLTHLLLPHALALVQPTALAHIPDIYRV